MDIVKPALERAFTIRIREIDADRVTVAQRTLTVRASGRQEAEAKATLELGKAGMRLAASMAGSSDGSLIAVVAPITAPRPVPRRVARAARRR